MLSLCVVSFKFRICSRNVKRWLVFTLTHLSLQTDLATARKVRSEAERRCLGMRAEREALSMGLFGAGALLNCATTPRLILLQWATSS